MTSFQMLLEAEMASFRRLAVQLKTTFNKQQLKVIYLQNKIIRRQRKEDIPAW